jgi:hypothetical protein
MSIRQRHTRKFYEWLDSSDDLLSFLPRELPLHILDPNYQIEETCGLTVQRFR